MIALRPATEADASAMLEIYSPIVRDTAISFELEPPTPQEFAQRVRSTMGKYPWLVAIEDRHVLGYAYASEHRARKAYQWCVETSVYVAPSAQKRGLGRTLYEELFKKLRAAGYINAYSGIALPNEPSVKIHESMGFKLIGVYPEIGFKFGKWHDVGWWHLRLQTPSRDIAPPNPVR